MEGGAGLCWARGLEERGDDWPAGLGARVRSFCEAMGYLGWGAGCTEFCVRGQIAESALGLDVVQ